jgi:hypothetical protein
MMGEFGFVPEGQVTKVTVPGGTCTPLVWDELRASRGASSIRVAKEIHHQILKGCRSSCQIE